MISQRVLIEGFAYQKAFGEMETNNYGMYILPQYSVVISEL